jgi:prepilin-type N-terminal cleavage/methylation domain-containing protein/prepilin-type processing-associated H-X9-DG protein
MKTHTLKGFTLIELLTVIAIIGVLAAILTVTIGRVRSAAQNTRCASNLRQMGPAFMMFALDNKNRYPTATASSTASKTWYYNLAPYLGQPPLDNWASVKRVCTPPNGPLGCPTTDVNDTSRSDPWISYKMTGAYTKYVKDVLKEDQDTYGLPTHCVTNPVKSLIVTEGRSHPSFTAVPVYYPHPGSKQNVLFADGHVATHTQSTLQTSWDLFYNHAVE